MATKIEESENITSIKVKIQIDTEKASNFITELADLANKYEIKADIDKSVISFDIANLLEIKEIYRLHEEEEK